MKTRLKCSSNIARCRLQLSSRRARNGRALATTSSPAPTDGRLSLTQSVVSSVLQWPLPGSGESASMTSGIRTLRCFSRTESRSATCHAALVMRTRISRRRCTSTTFRERRKPLPRDLRPNVGKCWQIGSIGKGGAEEESGGLLGFLGADARNRTEDPIITSDVLCQLSYVGSEDALGL